MLTKGDKLKFLKAQFLTDNVGKPLEFPTATNKNDGGVIHKVTENIIIKLANAGDICTFECNRPKNRLRVHFRALSGTYIYGDVPASEVRPLILTGSVK
jgi:hypothetical protein